MSKRKQKYPVKERAEDAKRLRAPFMMDPQHQRELRMANGATITITPPREVPAGVHAWQDKAGNRWMALPQGTRLQNGELVRDEPEYGTRTQFAWVAPD